MWKIKSLCGGAGCDGVTDMHCTGPTSGYAQDGSESERDSESCNDMVIKDGAHLANSTITADSAYSLTYYRRDLQAE